MSAHLQVVHMDDTVSYYQDFTDWKYASRDGVPVVLVRTGPPRTPGIQRIEIPLCNVRCIHVLGARENGRAETPAETFDSGRTDS